MIDLSAHVRTFFCKAALEAASSYQTFYPLDASLLETFELKKFALYELAGASADAKFTFVGSGAESIQQVIWSTFLETARKEGKTHFITSCLEEAPLLQMMKQLEELGCFVKVVRATKAGQIDLDHLKELLSAKSALVSFSLASVLTGVVQPIEEIIQIVKEKKVRLHFDASAAVGKMALKFSDWDLDYLTFSGESIYAGGGAAALFSKKGAPLRPFIFRSGILDMASFAGFSAAAIQATLLLDGFSLEAARLRDRFEREVCEQITGVRPLFEDVLRLPHVSALLFPKIHQETLLYFLNQRGVIASGGGGPLPFLGPLLSLCGIDEGDKAVSFGLSRYTTEDEIQKAVEILKEVVFQREFR